MSSYFLDFGANEMEIFFFNPIQSGLRASTQEIRFSGKAEVKKCDKNRLANPISYFLGRLH